MTTDCISVRNTQKYLTVCLNSQYCSECTRELLNPGKTTDRELQKFHNLWIYPNVITAVNGWQILGWHTDLWGGGDSVANVTSDNLLPQRTAAIVTTVSKDKTSRCKHLHESYSPTGSAIQMPGAKNVCGRPLCSRLLGFVSDSDRCNRHEHGKPLEMCNAYYDPMLM